MCRSALVARQPSPMLMGVFLLVSVMLYIVCVRAFRVHARGVFRAQAECGGGSVTAIGRPRNPRRPCFLSWLVSLCVFVFFSIFCFLPPFWWTVGVAMALLIGGYHGF